MKGFAKPRTSTMRVFSVQVSSLADAGLHGACRQLSNISRRLSAAVSSRTLRPVATSATGAKDAAVGSANKEPEGIRFVFEPEQRVVLKALRDRQRGPPTNVKPMVDISAEGRPLGMSG